MMLGMGPDIGAGVDDTVGGVNPIAIVVTLSTSKGKKKEGSTRTNAIQKFFLDEGICSYTG